MKQLFTLLFCLQLAACSLQLSAQISSPLITGCGKSTSAGGGGSTCPDYDSIGILRTDSATFLIMCCNGVACDTLPVFGSPGGGAIALWRQSGNAIVEVDTNMNVGIGTTAPTVPLEVNGDILFQMPSGAVITSGDDFEVFGVNAGSSQSINFNVSLADSLIGAVVYDNSDSFDYNWQLSSTYGAYIYTTSNDFNAGAGALPNDNASELYVLDNSIDKDISNVRCYSDSSVVLRWGSLGLRDSMRVAAGVITHITPPSITGNSFDKTLTITPFAGSAQKLVTAMADGTLDTASVESISPWISANTGTSDIIYPFDTNITVVVGTDTPILDAALKGLQLRGYTILYSSDNSSRSVFGDAGVNFEIDSINTTPQFVASVFDGDRTAAGAFQAGVTGVGENYTTIGVYSVSGPVTPLAEVDCRNSGLYFNPSEINTTAGDVATVNAIVGKFRKDTSGATFTLTNSYITANSFVLLTPANAAIDGTATTWTISTTGGSATISFNAAPTANFDMTFLVIN